MSALINRLIPLIFLSATHEIARRHRQIRRGHPSQGTGTRPADNSRESTANARVHSFAQRVHFAAGATRLQAEAAKDDDESFDEKMRRLVAQWREQQAEAAKLDAPIAKNLKELGYGG